MSPLENMFDPIMQTFLTPRSTVKSGEDGAKRVEKGNEEMDMDEDGVLKDVSPLDVKNTTKVVDEREMSGFVKIFKHHGLTGMNDLPTVRVAIMLCSSRGVSHGDYSLKPKWDRRRVPLASSDLPPQQGPTALQPRLPQSARASSRSRHHRYRSIFPQLRHLRWPLERRGRSLWLRSSYISVLMLYTRTVRTLQIRRSLPCL